MADEKRKITIDDVYHLHTLEDPQISPDGKWVAYVHAIPDRLDNEYHRNIWLSRLDGSREPVQLTRSKKDSSPRWSPDGKMLAFVSARAEKPQIYLLPIGGIGGEARALTSMPNGAMAPAWSPDGKHIAFLGSMNVDERAKEDSGETDAPPRDKLEAKHRTERRAEDDKTRLDPYPVQRIPYRAGTSFLGDRYVQVYVMATAEGLEKDDARPRRLTDVDANHDAPRWSADGKYLYTGRTLEVTDDEPYRRNIIYRISLVDSAADALTDDSHTSFSPVPSPDGKWVAFVRYPRDGSIGEYVTRLSVIPSDGGDVRDLNLELDRSVVDFEWAPDSKALVFSAGSRGDGPIHRVSPEGGTVETLAQGYFKALEVATAAEGTVVYIATTATTLPELYHLPAGASQGEPLTQHGKKYLDQVVVQPVTELNFKNSKGDEIQGWYILPVDYEEGKTYPLAVNIHGGPHVMWGPHERTMFHEWQLHAASGYAVFFCNPRGGDGYGEAFTKSLHADWGDVAFDDIMAGVDAVLEKGFVDGKRMAVTGGSYGGYMTAWVVGHTDRFVSAVTQRGVYNLLSFYGTSDIPSLISTEFDVNPWEDPDLLWQHSPLAYAHRVKTPLLIIHSENDYRVPIEQAEQLFAFVRRSGGTVKMLRYPRDGHELSRSGEPAHRVSRLTEMVKWFDRYCMPDGDAT